MTKNKNPGLPIGSKKVPIIGELTDKDRRLIDTAVQGMIKQIEPMLSGMGQMLDNMDKRVQILEEMVSATLVDIFAKRVKEATENELDIDSISFEDAVKRAGYKSVDAYLIQHGYKNKEKK